MVDESSKIYLEALRKGEFLKFLQWPEFIIAQYNLTQSSSDAEHLMDLLFFEWLNVGFTEEDVFQVALLYSMYDVIGGKRASALSGMTSALLFCMAFTDLKREFIKKNNHADGVQWIKSMTTMLSSKEWLESVVLQQKRFLSVVDQIDEKKKLQSYEQMRPILEYQRLVESYLGKFSYDDLKTDTLASSRIGLLESLVIYLKNQYLWRDDILDKIANCVEEIRDKQPQQWEFAYLNALVPLSIWEKSVDWLKKCSISFFQYVENTEELKSKEQKNRL